MRRLTTASLVAFSLAAISAPISGPAQAQTQEPTFSDMRIGRWDFSSIGTNPTWYDPSGIRGVGPLVVQKHGYGFGDMAQGISLYFNQTQQDADNGCALGGFGAAMRAEARGFVGATDQVAICNFISAALPLATLTYNSTGATDFTLVNDPNVNYPQYTVSSGVGGGFGSPQLTTGRQSQLTKIQFTTPLSASVVAGLRVNMIVRTSTGWTGFIKAWDPNGAWLTVDTWVQVLIGTSPVYVGFDPRAQAATPTGPAVSTMTLYINANQTIYGENTIVRHPAGAYCLFGYACGAEAKEVVLVNDAKPFVRGGGTCVTGRPCTPNEYVPFSDSPRDVGYLFGAGGQYPIAGSIAIWGGQQDKGIIVGEGQYAGVLIAPFGDFPMGDGFMSQQLTGNCYSAKNPAIQDYTFRVDCRTGAVEQGGQGPNVGTTRGSIAYQGPPGTNELTTDGATPGATGVNRPIAIPPNSSVSLTMQLQMSNTGDSARHLEWKVFCQWTRTGTAAPVVVPNALPGNVLEFVSPSNSAQYPIACGVDTTNGYGSIVIGNQSTTRANWVGAYTATVSPL